MLRGGSGSKNSDVHVYEPDRLYKLSGVVKDEKGFEFGVVERTISVDEFLNRASSLEQDLADIEQRYADAPTTRRALVEARIGQGKYREDLLDEWNGKCAVTKCPFSALLRASHAKPWAVSTDEDRLNPMNGLPLIANLDALFDRGYIGFDENGLMIVSPAFPTAHYDMLNLPASLWKRPNKAQAQFLAEHYALVFKKTG